MAKGLAGKRRKGLRWLSVLFATSMAAASISTFVAPGTALALGPGKVCLYWAPTGAQFGFVDFGHVGWEIQEPGRGYWAGATEQDSGLPSDSWMVDASSETTIHTDFSGDFYQHGKKQHSAGYYVGYRCHSTPSSSVGAAITTANQMASNGYTVITNDCLTKAVHIFTSYDSSNNVMWPGTASYPYPNGYFVTYLSQIGWGPIHYF